MYMYVLGNILNNLPTILILYKSITCFKIKMYLPITCYNTPITLHYYACEH